MKGLMLDLGWMPTYTFSPNLLYLRQTGVFFPFLHHTIDSRYYFHLFLYTFHCGQFLHWCFVLLLNARFS
jgi:hypothetical protein